MSVALSVVLPCFRAPALASQSVDRLARTLGGHVGSWEIIVVDDGGDDCRKLPLIREWEPSGQVRIISLPVNRGKGAAVAAGMLAATGATRVFTDIDLPYGTAPILMLEALIRTRGLHVVIGDRTFPQSQYDTNVSLGRRCASRAFSQITASLVTGGFFDTQCGLKGFRGDIAHELFALQKVERFAFDVELLYLALTYGLEIKRIPVNLEANSTSSVQLGRDSMRTLADLVRIRMHKWRGSYSSPVLNKIVASECDSLIADIRMANAAADLQMAS